MVLRSHFCIYFDHLRISFIVYFHLRSRLMLFHMTLMLSQRVGRTTLCNPSFYIKHVLVLVYFSLCFFVECQTTFILLYVKLVAGQYLLNYLFQLVMEQICGIDASLKVHFSCFFLKFTLEFLLCRDIFEDWFDQIIWVISFNCKSLSTNFSFYSLIYALI